MMLHAASLTLALTTGPSPAPAAAVAAVTPAAAPASAARWQACFAPGTPASVVEEVEREAESSAPLSSLAPSPVMFEFPDTNRWSQTTMSGPGLTQGDPTIVTWGIVTDGTPIPASSSGESSDPSNLRSWLNSQYGSSATWMPLFQSVFDRWSELTGLSYVYEPNDDGSTISAAGLPGQAGVRADVRIGGHRIDGTNRILAYNYYPPVGDMVIDTSDGAFSDKSNNSRFLRNTIAHEHGHGLGIRHVCPINETKLMEPYLTLRFDGPQFDDFLGGNRGYGDADEPNDATAAPTSLGTLVNGNSRTVTSRSVDDERDSDFFAFTIGDGFKATASVRPLGSTYLSGPQSASPCGPGASFDALRQQDLGVAVIDKNGSSIVAFTDNQPLGATETLSNVDLRNGAGTYFVQVYGKTSNKAQMYELTLSVTGPSTSAPTVYQSADPTAIVLPANAIGTATASPFDTTLDPGATWYYQLDDGTGNPPLIRLVKAGSALSIYF